MSQQHSGPTDDGQRRSDDGRATDQRAADQPAQEQEQGDVDGATEWFANTAVRSGLTLIGVVVLLFALGQAVGLPLLELFTEAITSETGAWLVVAFFAVLLIGAAQKVNATG